MLRVAVNNDVDLAPLFFPLTAGWVNVPPGIELVPGSVAEGLERLSLGKVESALVSPIVYANNQTKLMVVPTPVRAPDIATDSIFLISNKRLDKFERARVACSTTSAFAAGILKCLAGNYYGFQPEILPVESDTAALDALQGTADMCLISGEVGMRSAGRANARGYEVQDLTKAWWILTGLPLPIGMFVVRRDWTQTDPEASQLVRSMMLMFRSALQQAKNQMATIAEKEERRTGIPASALVKHYTNQRHELNEAHIRALLEFFKRANLENLVPPVNTFDFFPSSLKAEPASALAPRRAITEAEVAKNRPKPDPRVRAEEKGLRVIKGGKDKSKPTPSSDENED
jgi:predicted solute-binding protein